MKAIDRIVSFLFAASVGRIVKGAVDAKAETGWNNGYKYGYKLGLDHGLGEGLQEGRDQGYSSGLHEGTKRGIGLSYSPDDYTSELEWD